MEKIRYDVSEHLKSCPRGTQLYSPLFDKDKEYNCWLELQDTTEQRIKLFPLDLESSWRVTLSNDGSYSGNGECLLFPSKEVRNWGCFRAKYAWGGDGITNGKKVKTMLLDYGGKGPKNGYWSCDDPMAIYYIDTVTNEITRAFKGFERDYILSTGTELKLEEEEKAKFKVGDVAKWKCDEQENISCVIDTIKTVKDIPYRLSLCQISDFEETDNIKFTLATPEEIAKWNEEVLQPKHLHYDSEQRKIIHWFLPFDKCVIRGDKDSKWTIGFFSFYDNAYYNHPYKCGQAYWVECLPYNEKTAKLIGTTDDYEEDE